MLPKGAEVDNKRRSALPYRSMSLEDIADLPIKKLAEPDGCHLYLWTTNRYLAPALDICREWGFRYSQTLVWAKKPMGMGPGGTYVQNAEYIIFARHGTLKANCRIDSVWFNWPRTAKHSKKPEGFYQMVEKVSPGPCLDMFARKQREGWDVFGDEVERSIVLPS